MFLSVPPGNKPSESRISSQSQTFERLLVRLLPKAELLNGEIFYSLKEAQIIIEGWRCHYNTIRPHSSLGYQPPAPEVELWPAAPPRQAPPAIPTIAPRPVMH